MTKNVTVIVALFSIVFTSLNSTVDNSNFFEAYLLLALDSLKKKDYKKSKKNLQSSYEFIKNDRLSLIIIEILKEYIYVFEENKISITKNKFGNFSLINQAFQRCYLNDKNTKTYFKQLFNSQNDVDSRGDSLKAKLVEYGNYMAANNISGRITEEDGTVRVFNSSSKTYEAE